MVKEDWFNFDWDFLSPLSIMAPQMDALVAATAAAHGKMDVKGGGVLSTNQVAESALNV